MDYGNCPESFYAPELAKTPFAASPNSLFMYDQERHDMQNTLNNSIFSQTCFSADVATFKAEHDFDLNPQYENSNSLEGFFGGALKCDELSGGCDTNMEDSPCSRLEKSVPGGLLGLLEMNSRQDLKLGGPTLAELNMDPFLMDDIDTIISNGDGTEKPRSQTAKSMDTSDFITVKASNLEVKSESSQETLTPLQCFNPIQTQSRGSGGDVSHSAMPLTNLFGTKSKVAVVQPVSATSLIIKKEPVDNYNETSCTPAKSASLHKLLSPESSPPRKVAVTTLSSTSPQAVEPRQVMPVTGQTRAPPLGQLVKSESVEEKWKEIEKFIHDPESSSSNKRKRHASEASSAMSDDEDYKSTQYGGGYSDDDSDSDADSDISDTPLEDYSLADQAKKSKQYFWQYNVQAKGPKGTRLKLNVNDSDPHHPSNFEDPVFDVNSTSLVGIRHGGKARKGDGNEVTPNPRKLFQIGKQLFKLTRQINGFQVSNDVPASVRNKSRKEKNKLASRACRLKKKAQHEANKVKLTGLDYEQGELLDIVRLLWPQLRKQARLHMKGVATSPGSTETLSDKLDALIKAKHKTNVAGNTTEFVNEVIAKVEAGDLTGGLDIKVKVKK